MLNILYFFGNQNPSYLYSVHHGRFSVATLDLIMIYDICVRLRACLVDQGSTVQGTAQPISGKGFKSCRRLARMRGKPVVMGPVHRAIAAGNPTMTLPTKVRSDSLGRIGSLKRTSDK